MPQRLLLKTIVLLLLAISWAPAGVSKLHVPQGFVVECVAAAPLVEHPMMAGLDDRGRLFVADNAGVNVDFKQLEKNPPSRILMLQDTDGDGTFDKRTVFADKLTFPSGALWYRGALYATAAPGLWRFEDTDGDGVADKREQIVTGFGSTGNGADLHGPYLGPEGWLYFCDGRNGHDVTLGDGTRWTGKAACVYRCRADGSGLEVVFGGGFDNPVEAVFTPQGELLVNVNIFQSQPHRIDAIVFGLEGANYPHADVWKELKRTGDLMPSVGDLGWVATSGFMRYRAGAAGDGLHGRYFSTQFNTHAVKSHTVERDGAGFRIDQSDFLSSDDTDFHPTDVLQDPGGSLIVIDTGGWFRIGCPNSQIAKPQVKGAIYRIRRDGKKSEVSPGPEEMRLESFWAMAAAETAQSRWSVRAALSSEDASLRIAAAHAAGLSLDREATAELIQQLQSDSSPAVRRECATALGRIRAREAVAPLLARSRLANDRFEEHAIIFALIRIADREGTIAGLQDTNPAVRRTALIALDQMTGGNLTAELVAPQLAGDNPALHQTALSIATAHPDWAEPMVAHIRAALSAAESSEKESEALVAAVAAFSRSSPVQALVAEVLTSNKSAVSAKLLLLRAVAESGVSPLPDAWVEPVRRSLGDGDERLVIAAVEAIRATGSDKFDAELSKVARDSARPASLRVAALAIALPHRPAVDASDFRFLMAELAPDRAPLARLSAAQTISASPLNDPQLIELAGVLPRAGPVELPALISAFERSGNPEVGVVLVRSLEGSKSLAGLTSAGLSRALAKYPADVQRSAAALIDKLNPNAAAQKARLAELEPLLSGGNPSRGQSVFISKQAACTTCHAVRGSGAHVGPDLSKIASIRSGRDLLESIAFPSASFARGYEPFVVQTKSKQAYAGVLAAETVDAIILRTPAEVRIPRASVESIRQDRVSIMPQGLDAQLTPRELSDLLAFLQSLK